MANYGWGGDQKKSVFSKKVAALLDKKVRVPGGGKKGEGFERHHQRKKRSEENCIPTIGPRRKKKKKKKQRPAKAAGGRKKGEETGEPGLVSGTAGPAASKKGKKGVREFRRGKKKRGTLLARGEKMEGGGKLPSSHVPA